MITAFCPRKRCTRGSHSDRALHPCHPLPQPDLVTVAAPASSYAAAQALNSLMAAIDGWKGIVPVSGWRALAEQQAIWDGSLAENGLPFTQTYVACPGCSEHQTGLAIDLGLNQGEIDFIRPAFPYEGLCQTFRQTMAQYGMGAALPGGEGGHHRHRPRALALPLRGPAPRRPHGGAGPDPGRVSPGSGHFLRIPSIPPRECDLFLPAAPQGPTVVDLPEEGRCTLSGNNVDGFLLTEWGEDHA